MIGDLNLKKKKKGQTKSRYLFTEPSFIFDLVVIVGQVKQNGAEPGDQMKQKRKKHDLTSKIACSKQIRAMNFIHGQVMIEDLRQINERCSDASTKRQAIGDE